MTACSISRLRRGAAIPRKSKRCRTRQIIEIGRRRRGAYRAGRVEIRQRAERREKQMPKFAKPTQRRRQVALELSATELHQAIARAALECLRQPREPRRLNVDRGF